MPQSINRYFLPQIAALNAPRIHSETVFLLTLALDSIACNSSGVTRMRKVPIFAVPFGSGGRPAFLAFFCRLKASKLLYDCRLSGEDRRDMWKVHMAFQAITVPQ